MPSLQNQLQPGSPALSLQLDAPTRLDRLIHLRCLQPAGIDQNTHANEDPGRLLPKAGVLLARMES